MAVLAWAAYTLSGAAYIVALSVAAVVLLSLAERVWGGLRRLARSCVLAARLRWG